MKTVAFAFALCILLVGVTGLLSPSTLLPVAHLSLAPGAFLILATLRLGFGLLLIEVASRSRMPRTIRVIGLVVALMGIATALTAFLAMDRARAIIDHWTQSGDGIQRLTCMMIMLFGGFLAYCLAPRRSHAGT